VGTMATKWCGFRTLEIFVCSVVIFRLGRDVRTHQIQSFGWPVVRTRPCV